MAAPAHRIDITLGGHVTPSLAEVAYEELLDRLVTLRIAPGEPLHDNELATELGIGRTPVREALKRLEGDRLVATFPRRGTFATRVEITDLTHITEVRRQLEPMGARAAALRATDTQRGRLRELLPATNRPIGELDAAALMDLDLTIHRALYDATNNPYLAATLRSYDNLATRIWCLFLPCLPNMAAHVVEHRDLLDHVVAGQPDDAAALALAHLEHFETAIRAAM